KLARPTLAPSTSPGGAGTVRLGRMEMFVAPASHSAGGRPWRISTDGGELEMSITKVVIGRATNTSGIASRLQAPATGGACRNVSTIRMRVVPAHASTNTLTSVSVFCGVGKRLPATLPNPLASTVPEPARSSLSINSIVEAGAAPFTITVCASADPALSTNTAAAASRCRKRRIVNPDSIARTGAAAHVSQMLGKYEKSATERTAAGGA